MDKPSPGVIDASQAYTLSEFRKRAGIGDYVMRQLRRDGFPVVKVGRKMYVRGVDWLNYLEKVATNQK